MSSSRSKLSKAEGVLHLHRALLKAVFLTTSSALHRPRVLPAIPFPSIDIEVQAMSRTKVRYAAAEITNIIQELHNLNLTRYYPTTGVTVLLPAIIIHLLDIKSSDPKIRMASLKRFHKCMHILYCLREIYASADFATSFLEAAIRKAGVQLTVTPQDVQSNRRNTSSESNRLDALKPPPDPLTQIPDPSYPNPKEAATDARTAEDFFSSTPPHSDSSENGNTKSFN